jgi:hypothetical protein
LGWFETFHGMWSPDAGVSDTDPAEGPGRLSFQVWVNF